MALTLTPKLTDEVLRLPLFAGVSKVAVTTWLRARKQRGFNQGQALFRQGDPAGSMYIVVEGQVLVARETSAGEQLRLAELGMGQVIGELSVLSPATRSASALWVGRGGVVEVTRDDMEQGLALRDPVAIAVLRNLSLQLCDRILATDQKLARVQAMIHGTSPEQLQQNLGGLIDGDKKRGLATWLRRRR
jgi:CRP-like cAMP-binding protein